MWLEDKFEGESGPYKNFRIRYMYQNPKNLGYYQAWGYGSGTDEADAGKEFVDFIKDQNGYKKVKIIKVDRVAGKSASGENLKPAGLTNRTPTNQKIDINKFKKP